ncbi:hypothetical protein X760_05975 [Mesorhizobium sp. LSHC422A00]|uniref:hypothetical protein n=1 Tax=Mesorhizobium sp. LSHC422A00 TaxID=1287294 RepID=UPI0003CECC6C|nr:hypothetical protein [Mesorhizobium sp. LSHC422A00]ESX62666.1 hypothetical protein X760_05975 [Mesorhizobium sp. LSHC422A00]
MRDKDSLTECLKLGLKAACLLLDVKAAEADVPTDGSPVKFRPNPVMLAALRISQDGFYIGDQVHSAVVNLENDCFLVIAT